MNWDGIESNWLQIKGLVRRRWAELSDADIVAMRGKGDALAQRLRDRYGLSAAEADIQIEGWLRSLKPSRAA